MSHLTNKIVWNEGMLLCHQQFQQQDRYHEALMHFRASILNQHGWGINKLEFDVRFLTDNKIGLSSISGIFPDGTCFDAAGNAQLPSLITIAETQQQATLYLGVKHAFANGNELAITEQSQQKYLAEDLEYANIIAEADDRNTLQIAKVQLHLLLDTDDRHAFSCIPIAELRRDSSTKSLMVNQQFCASGLNLHAIKPLYNYAEELDNILEQRRQSIIGQIAKPNRNDIADITELLVLQTINRTIPLLKQVLITSPTHPIKLYELMLQLAGELSTFASHENYLDDLPLYMHDNLSSCFHKIMFILRSLLQAVSQSNAIHIPLVQKENNISIATISDHGIFKNCDFILAAKAQMPLERLLSELPKQLKLAPLAQVQALVQSQLPGVALTQLSVAPPQIPYYAGYSYFQLDHASHFWQEIEKTGGLGVHVNANFPQLKLSLWAIRRES